MSMGINSGFCDEHWDVQSERIQNEKINGLALSMLLMDGTFSHEECPHMDQPADTLSEIEEYLCCWLEDKTTYSEDSEEFDNDYEVVVAAAEVDVSREEIPEEWWVNRSD